MSAAYTQQCRNLLHGFLHGCPTDVEDYRFKIEQQQVKDPIRQDPCTPPREGVPSLPLSVSQIDNIKEMESMGIDGNSLKFTEKYSEL